MTVGSVNEVVTVAANGSGIDTETPNTEQSLSTEELDKVQVRSYDIMEALTLVAGSVDTASGTHDAPDKTSGASISINGTRSDSRNLMIDGVASSDPQDGTTINTLPSIGMVQELKVLSSNFRADSGRNSGPSVIIVTKGGTDQLHGSLDFPFRNEFFDANDPDRKRQGLPKTQYRLILPSYTVTGPILIPHVIGRNDHLFFVVSQQYEDRVTDPLPATKIVSVPTAAERMGIFTSANGYNGKTLAISPIGQAILNMFPLPNISNAVNGINNYSSSTSLTTNRWSDLFRIDWQPTSKTSMYVRFLYSPENDQSAWNPQANANNGGFSNISWNEGLFQNLDTGTGFLYNLTETFSANLVNTLGLSSSTTELNGTALNPSGITAAGTGVSLPSLFPNANPAGYLPNIAYSCPQNTQSCTTSTFVANDTPASFILDSQFPNRQHLHSFQLTDNLTKVWGTHSIVAGVFLELVHRNAMGSGINSLGTNDRGAYSFLPDSSNACDTGDPFANILTGCIESYSQNSVRERAYLRFRNNEFYIQDEWRATPRLTLTYGLRLYHDAPAHDALNQLQVFVPALYNAAAAPRLWKPSLCGTPPTQCSVDTQTGAQAPYSYRGLYVPGSSSLANPETNGIVQAGTNGIPRSVFTIPTISWAPRFGFNYALTRDNSTIIKGGFGIYYDRFPLLNVFNMFANPPGNQQETVNQVQSYSQVPSLQGLPGPPKIATLPTGRILPPVTKSFSVEIQRQLGRDGLIGIAYVGNVSQHQIATTESDGPTLYSQLSALHPENIDTSQYTYNTSGQITNSIPCYGAPCMLPTPFVNTYHAYSSIRNEFTQASSNYNGLQVSVAKRMFHRHLQLRGNWTYSKALGIASSDNTVDPADPNEPIRPYSPENFDRRHLINFFYILDFPNPGRALNSRFVSGIADGWSASGVARFSTGAPFTPTLDLTDVPGSGPNGLAGTGGNVVTGSTDGARPVLVSKQAKLTAGDANGKFTGPTVGTWGNLGLNALNFPSWEEFDLSLYRTFHPTEKVSMIFRTEIYNVPNSTIVSSLNPVLEFQYQGHNVPQATGVNGVTNANPGFYQAASGGGFNGQQTNFFRRGRIIQFDLSARF
jgi:hypothetical protein